MSPQTLAQKLIAHAAQREQVVPGEIVNAKVDLAMFHDSSGPRRLKPMLDELGAHIWDPARVVLVMDHYVPERDDESRRIVRIARDWAGEVGLTHVYDSQGICHVVLPERGHLRPGLFCVGGDSHSPTGGAFGAFMFGIGSTEMLGVMVTGELWIKVPQTIRMRWDARLMDGVSAKDMMLHMIGRFGMNGGQYQAVEYTGSAVTALSMAERMTLANMTAELGGQTGLIAPDRTTREWLAGVCVEVDASDVERWRSDPDAPLLAEHVFDAATLAPQVALPHSPSNAKPVVECAGQPIDVAYIGACNGAKLDDLRAAARVLQGRHVASGIELMVAPASLREQAVAEAEGVMQTLRDAGAQVLPMGCGACAGYGSRFKAGSRVVSTTARNFRGRMGGTDTEVFLASPFTVAASALRGTISDPREVLA
ncbi:MAG: 3-isopropylmalate dehydratase large subunit [Burkholderiaceae bacterium]